MSLLNNRPTNTVGKYQIYLILTLALFAAFSVAAVSEQFLESQLYVCTIYMQKTISMMQQQLAAYFLFEETMELI